MLAPKAMQAQSAEPAAKSQVWSDPEWSQLVAKLELTGADRMLASNCAYLRREENTVFLSLDPRAESMLTKQRKDAISESLSTHFGEHLLVDITLGSAVEETQNIIKNRRSRRHLQRLVRIVLFESNTDYTSDTDKTSLCFWLTDL